MKQKKNHPRKEKQQWKRIRTTTKIELISVGKNKKGERDRDRGQEKILNIRVKERDPRVFKRSVC